MGLAKCGSSLLEKLGITSLSELIIDADKDWEVMGISNIKEVATAMQRGDMITHDDTKLAKLVPGRIGDVMTTMGHGKPITWRPAHPRIPVGGILPTTDIGATSARVNGIVLWDNGDICDYRFRYRKVGEAWDYTTWGTGKYTGDTFHEDIAGLEVGATYEVQTQLQNIAGESPWSATETYTTLAPLADPEPASDITDTEAKINGKIIEDLGEDCEARFRRAWALSDDFEWGNDGDDIDDSGGNIIWTKSTPDSSTAKISTAEAYSGTRNLKLYRNGATPTAHFAQPAGTDYIIRVRVKTYADAYAGVHHGNGSMRLRVKYIDANLRYFDGTAWQDTGATIGNDWVLLEIKNINWTAGTYDIFHNGEIAKAGAEMFSSTGAANIIVLINSKANRNAWFDNVEVSNITSVTNLCLDSQGSPSDTGQFDALNSALNIVASPSWVDNSALEVDPTGASNDSAAQIEGGGVTLGMQSGKTYTAQARIYVPAATGLVPDHTRGLRIVAFTRETGGSYVEHQSSQADAVDEWVFLQVTFTLPDNPDHAFIRLYNGFQDIGKVVYWDGIQVEGGGKANDWGYGTHESGRIYTDWQNSLRIDDTFHEDLTGLYAGTEHAYQCQARLAAMLGEGHWSASETFKTLA